MFKAIKEFFAGKKVEELQSAAPMAPIAVPYKVEAVPKAELVVEAAPVVAVEKPAKKTRTRSSTPKAKIAKIKK